MTASELKSVLIFTHPFFSTGKMALLLLKANSLTSSSWNSLLSLFTSVASFSSSPHSFSGILLLSCLNVSFRTSVHAPPLTLTRQHSHQSLCLSTWAGCAHSSCVPGTCSCSLWCICSTHLLAQDPLVLHNVEKRFCVVSPILTLGETDLLCMPPSPKILTGLYHRFSPAINGFVSLSSLKLLTVLAMSLYSKGSTDTYQVNGLILCVQNVTLVMRSWAQDIVWMANWGCHLREM